MSELLMCGWVVALLWLFHNGHTGVGTLVAAAGLSSAVMYALARWRR